MKNKKILVDKLQKHPVGALFYSCLLFFVFVFITTFRVEAQTTSFKHFGMEDGLANMQGRKVIELPDNRMLVQVEGVFCIYDGERFHNLEYDRNYILSINSNLNTDYYFDKKNRLWVKDNTHLFVLDTKTCRFLHPGNILKVMTDKHTIANFFLDDLGNAIIETDNAEIFRYDWKNPPFLLMTVNEKNVEGFTERLADVCRIGQNYMLFFSNGKMRTVTISGKNANHNHTFIDSYMSHRLKALKWNEQTLIVRDADGLVSYDIALNRSTRILEDPSVFEFRKTTVNGKYVLYVSCSQKLMVFNQDLKQIKSYGSIIDQLTEKENNDPLQGMAIDRQGGIWVATFNNGVFYRPELQEQIKYICFEQGTDFYRAWVLKDVADCLPASCQITDVCRDASENLWISTRNEGFVMINPAEKSIYPYHYSDVDGLWGTVAFIRPLNDHQLLLCSRMNRLGVFDLKTKQLDNLTDTYPKLMQFRNMVAITPVKDGFLIGTQNGFFAFDTKHLCPDLKRFEIINNNPYSDKCNCLLNDGRGVIWIGTQNGLLRYDENGQLLKRYSVKDGLPNNCIQSMVLDKKRCLWIATLGGICRMETDKQTPNFMTIAERFHKGNRQFLERQAVAIGDSLFFGTENGVYALAPDHLKPLRMNLVPQIMSLMVNDSILDVRENEQHILNLEFPYNHNNLVFNISALNYASPENTIYRYRIENGNNDWMMTDAGEGNLRLSYSALQPGTYTFVLQAAVQGQEWGEKLRIVVSIAPPWWKTWWAYLIYCFVAFVLIAYFVASYIRSQRNRMAMEQKEARIRQLLEQIRLKSQLPEHIQAETNEEIHVSKEDEQFLQKAMACVENHLADPDYGVEQFSSDMAMERTTLYRHLQSAIGKPPKEFIRTIRIKRAAELLRSRKYQVGEVADLVGFSNRKSFSKFFKDAFGVLPSKYE